MSQASRSAAGQVVSCRLGELLLGIDIASIREINRILDVTPIADTPPHIKGVVNLRGEVVTVFDLRIALGLPPAEITARSRNVIVDSQGEMIGLLVDSVGETYELSLQSLDPVPPNVSAGDRRMFSGVRVFEHDLLLVLDVESVLAVEPALLASSA